MMVPEPDPDGTAKVKPRKMCFEAHPGFCPAKQVHHIVYAHVAKNLVNYFSGEQRKSVIGNLYKFNVLNCVLNTRVVMIGMLTDVRFANPAYQLFSMCPHTAEAADVNGAAQIIFNCSLGTVDLEVIEHGFTGDIVEDMIVAGGGQNVEPDVLAASLQVDIERMAGDLKGGVGKTSTLCTLAQVVPPRPCFRAWCRRQVGSQTKKENRVGYV